MPRYAVSLVLAAALLLAGCATVPDPMVSDTQFMAMFEAMDTDRDGYISEEEFLAAYHDREQAREIFHAADLDGDGRISLEEALARRQMIVRREMLKRDVLRLTEPR
jgi:Ca2+-binding EF-hand superfamily protein